MGIVGIVGIVLGGILAILLTIFILLFWKGNRPSTDTPPEDTPPERKPWGNTPWIIAGLVFLYPYLTWQFLETGGTAWSLWYENFISIWFLVTLAGFVLFGLMLESKKPFKPTLGRWGIAILVVMTIWHFAGTKILQEVERSNLQASNLGTTSVVPVTVTPWNTDFPKELEGNAEAQETYNFWVLYSGLSLYDAVEMFEVCRAESDGLHQFGEDGKPLRSETDDVGICQLHEPDWLKKPVELTEKEEPWDSEGNLKPAYDMNQLQGNLRLAIWIRNKYGPEKWETLPQVRRKMGRGVNLGSYQETVLAPLDGPGPAVVIPEGRNFSFEFTNPVCVYTGHGPCTPGGVGAKIPFPGKIESLRFQSLGKEAVKQTVTIL